MHLIGEKSLGIAASLAVAAAVILPASPAAASPPLAPAAVAPEPRSNTFPERYSVNAAGDLVITGNTLMTCPDSVSTCAEARRGGGTSSRFNNNSYSMIMVDIDTDPSTINSSSADLLIPPGAPVLFAGLYWGAGASGDQMKGPVPSGAGSVKVRVPGATSYQAVNATKLSTIAGVNNKTYSAVADVTSLVSQSGRGTYVIADVKGDLGINHFAGWSLVVIYGDPTEPVRAMSVYDGLVSVERSASATINVSGFRTPPNGPVRTALGVVAYEGDLGITGDQFTLNGTALGSAIRPVDNFFNSTITTKTSIFESKAPNYRNQLGFDAGLIDATGRIANNATQATFQASSTGDQYYPAALTFSTELFSPRFDAVKSVADINGDVVRPGDVLQYSLALKNDVGTDNGDASTGTVITDTLPIGAVYVPGSLIIDGQSVPDSGSVATISGNTLTIRVGTGASATTGGRLAIGASTLISYRMEVESTTPGGTVLTNDFRVVGTAATSGFGVTGISNEVRAPVVANGADLSIVKSAPSALVAGQIATYSLSVSNAGPGSATSVAVADAIPSGLDFVDAAGPGWSCVVTAGTLTCERSTLASGATAPLITLTFRVPETAADSASIVNTATVSSDTLDPDPSDNSSQTTTPIDRLADLAIRKWHEGSAIPGDRITYTLAVRNEGPSQATGVLVTDPVPGGLALVSASGPGWSCSGTMSVTCSRADALAPGESADAIHVVAEILPSVGASITNTATVSGNETDPTPDNDSSTDGAVVNRIFDGIESVSHPGEAIAGGPAVPLTILGYNAGPGLVPAGAEALHTVTLPIGTSLLGHSGGSWTCIPATASATTSPLTVTCRTPLASDWAAQSGLIPLVLDVAVEAGETEAKRVTSVLSTTSDVREVDIDNNTATDIITLEDSADLELITTSSAMLVAGGPSQALAFTVRNNGPVGDAGPIVVRFGRLSSLDLASASGSPWSCASPGDSLVCTLSGVPLAVGETAPALALEVRASDPAALPATYELTGIVSSPQPDDNPANDAATAPITVTTFADIHTIKSASPTTLSAGDAVTYTITVSNAAPYGGPSVARDVYMTDDLGALGMVVESVTATTDGLDCSASTESVVSCYTSALAVGAYASARVVARTDPAWSSTGRTVTNVVTATSSTPGADRPPGSSTIVTNQSSALSISKTVRGRTADQRLRPGSFVTYVMAVANDGPADAVGATVVDVMPGVLTPRVAVGDGWTCEIDGQRVTCTTTDVLPVGGAVPRILVTGLLDPDASGAITNSADVEPQSPGTGGTDTVTIPAEDTVDLDIAHFGPSVLEAGDDWTTTIVVRNNGPATEPGPIRVEIEQSGADPQRARGAGWRCEVEGRQILCTTETRLRMGASLPAIEVTSSTSRSGTQVNSIARVSGQREDIDRSNNRSATSAILERDVDIAAFKTANKNMVKPGGKVTYTLKLTNNGPGATSDAQIVDDIPAGLVFDQAASDPRCTNEQVFVQCSAGETLKAGASTDFLLVARVSVDAEGTITNRVTGSSSQPDPNPSNNRDSSTVTVQSPEPPPTPQFPDEEPPDRIKDKGSTRIYPERPTTNAGQYARVRITCQPLVTRVARGDFEYCRLSTRSDGSIWVTVAGTSALQITIRLTAPAVSGYTRMDVSYRYATARVR